MSEKPKDEDAVLRALDWVEAEADKWAVEINLPQHIKNLCHVMTLNSNAPAEVRNSFHMRLEQGIDALVRQTFLEAWLRSHDSYKDYLANKEPSP